MPCDAPCGFRLDVVTDEDIEPMYHLTVPPAFRPVLAGAIAGSLSDLGASLDDERHPDDIEALTSIVQQGRESSGLQ